jgi:hypothetical protein
MMIAYLPGVFFPEYGFKIANVLYVLLAAVLIGFLVTDKGQSWGARVAAIVFAQIVFFLPERFWFETLSQGSNDILPIALILAALLALKQGRDFWIGLFTGLSFTAKFAPAVFLMPFSPIHRLKYWFGFALGCTPFLPFVVWDLGGLIRNAFIFRFMVGPDATSMFSVLPGNLHWLLSVTVLAGLAVTLYSYFRQNVPYRTALVGFTLLLILTAATFKEVHGNHLTWFFPLFALIFTDYRERLFGLISGGFMKKLAPVS